MAEIDEFENWASFEAVDVAERAVEDIESAPTANDDPDLIAAAELLGLTLG